MYECIHYPTGCMYTCRHRQKNMRLRDLTPIDLESNNLLKSLQQSDLQLLIPYLQQMSAERGYIIFEPGDDVKHTYFPCGSTLVSFLVHLDDGRGVETALIGREGAVGGIVSQGRLPAYCRAVVQFSGNLLSIESTRLEEAKTASLTLRHLFARYSDCLLAQVFQSVACNATHTIEQRAAKWLVAALDRTGDHIIPLSQEQLAGMLGVGRSYVAKVIGTLKSRGVLETMRGQLCIHSVDELKALSCGCNEMVNQHFDTVLRGVYPHDGD